MWVRGGVSGGNTDLGNLPFTLHLMPKETGFSDDAQGTRKYINICKRNGLLPVGCGDCDKYRINGEPCLAMPTSWGCNMLRRMYSNTGWDNIVTFLSNGRTDSVNNGRLYTHTQGWVYRPSPSYNLHPVCGKVAGIF